MKIRPCVLLSADEVDELSTNDDRCVHPRTRTLELLKISQNYYVSVHGSKNRRIEWVIKEIELNE